MNFFKALILSGLFFSQSVFAYVGAVSAGTADAGTAAVEASEAPFRNPATIGYLTGYYFSAGFGAIHQTSGQSAQDLSVSLTDNMRETVVPTSFSYLQENTKPDQGENTLHQQFKLSFGNMIREGVGFGFAVQHLADRISQQSYSQTNVQTGLLIAPTKDIGAAVLFDNLIPASSDVPDIYRTKQTMAIGGSYNYRRFVRVKADVISATNNSFDHPTLAAGMESYMNRWLILRWGVQRNNEKAADVYAGGLGFISPRFGLHYAYQNSPQDESLTRHSVDLAIPIW